MNGLFPRRRLGAAAAVALTLLLLPAAAEARTVSCGEVITEDTRVDNDLDCSYPGSLLQIAADGVTLDLNGHTLSNRHPRGGGVRSLNHDRVTVRNGTIVVAFLSGGLSLTGSHNRVVDLVARAYVPIGIGGSHNVVTRSVAQGFGGISVRGDRNSVTHNSSTGTFSLTMGGVGNHVARNDFAGLIDLYEGRTLVTRNTAGGLEVRGGRHSATRNDFGRFGIHLRGGDRTLLERNSVTGTAIRIGSTVPQAEVATNSQVVRNVVTGSPAGGIIVEVGSTGTRLWGNRSSDNAEDGIHVGEPRTWLTRNVATNNGGNGIEAVAGVRDGGGNRASGNATAPQCINVRCR